MAKQPLIQARIRTRLGNVVTRLVKPDNPNIVEVITERQPLAGTQATRRARTVMKPKPAKVDPVVAAEPKPIRTDWQEASHHGCCGGRVLIAHDVFEKDEEPFDEAKLRTEWERSPYGKKVCDDYETYAKQYEEALAYLVKNGRNMPGYQYRTRDDLRRDADYYLNLIKNTYGWEAALKRRACYGVSTPVYVKPDKPLMGVTVSVREFPGSHQSPAGLWLRSDQDPGTSNKMHLADMATAVSQPEKIKTYDSNGSVSALEPSSVKPTDHWILSNMQGKTAQAERNWTKIKQLVATKKAKAGTLITFILNHNQNDKATDESLAAAGFQCVLCTGNKNHGNSSVLYLYERRLTERDIELLTNG